MSEKLCALRKIGGGMSNGSGVAVVGQEIKVTLGYKPSDVWVMFYKDDSHFVQMDYHENFSNDKSICGYKNGTPESSSFMGLYPLPYTGGYMRIKSIDNDGFTITAPTQAYINEYGSNYIWSANK